MQNNKETNPQVLRHLSIWMPLVDGDIKHEMEEAILEHGGFHSYHEGYGVLKEEVDELWDEIKKKKKDYSYEKLYHEAIQVAAMSREIALYAAQKINI